MLHGSRGVYVVPIWELTRDVESSPAMRVLASRGTKPVSAVWWYRRLEPERADPVVAICVGADGEVRAWDVAKGSPLQGFVVGAKCANAELARGNRHNSSSSMDSTVKYGRSCSKEWHAS